jgi:hypothetical protein
MLLLLAPSGRTVMACGQHDHLDHDERPKRRLRTRPSATVIERQAQGNHTQYTHSHRHTVKSLNGATDDFPTEACGFIEPSPRQIAIDQVNMRQWKEAKIAAANNTFARGDKNLKDRSFGTAAIYSIPTYFHIVQPNFSTGLVSDERIDMYTTYLNAAFTNSKAPFSFNHIKTTRTINALWGDRCGIPEVEISLKSSLKVGRAESLNIYICNEVQNTNGQNGIAGFSFIPYAGINSFVRDGVVLARSDNSDSRLNTLVHEVG